MTAQPKVQTHWQRSGSCSCLPNPTLLSPACSTAPVLHQRPPRRTLAAPVAAPAPAPALREVLVVTPAATAATATAVVVIAAIIVPASSSSATTAARVVAATAAAAASAAPLAAAPAALVAAAAPPAAPISVPRLHARHAGARRASAGAAAAAPSSRRAQRRYTKLHRGLEAQQRMIICMRRGSTPPGQPAAARCGRSAGGNDGGAAVRCVLFSPTADGEHWRLDLVTAKFQYCDEGNSRLPAHQSTTNPALLPRPTE